MNKSPSPNTTIRSADPRDTTRVSPRPRVRPMISAAEILRTVRACERAGKNVVSLSVGPDGGYQLQFGELTSAPQELDLVKMAKDHG
jgi:hypothetical protein